MTRSDRVSELLAVTSRLIACMEKEVGLLRSLRPQDIGPLQADKAKLAGAYEAHIAALRAPDADLDALDPALAQELTNATERLQAAIAENVRALKAAREVNDRVLKAIVEGVQQDNIPAAAYGRSGPRLMARRSAAPVSVSLDGRF